MHRLGGFALGALIIMLGWAFAYADEPAPAEGFGEMAAVEDSAAPTQNAYGFSMDDIAVNQGVVAYWYAHGFANAFGSLPVKWADVEARKILLREFVSPFTGEKIDFDDGALDFDGDMTYRLSGCDAMIQVKTSTGVVSLPGTIPGGRNSCSSGGNCNSGCASCCDITICGWDYWGCLCPDEAICKIIQWMLWNSFETYECRYGCRPADEMMWLASGLAPVGKSWQEYAPQMNIEYIYKKCSLVKAKVHCCRPCGIDKCNSCGTCGHKAQGCNSCGKQSCGGCKTKCNSGGNCGKSNCGSCKTKSSCNNCGKSSCGSCKSKSGCNSCGKSNCGGNCKSKSSCNSCGKSGCDKCHAKSGCNNCGKSSCKGNCGRGNCDTCQPAYDCDRCGGKGCNSCREDDGGTWVS